MHNEKYDLKCNIRWRTKKHFKVVSTEQLIHLSIIMWNAQTVFKKHFRFLVFRFYCFLASWHWLIYHVNQRNVKIAYIMFQINIHWSTFILNTIFYGKEIINIKMNNILWSCKKLLTVGLIWFGFACKTVKNLRCMLKCVSIYKAQLSIK